MGFILTYLLPRRSCVFGCSSPGSCTNCWMGFNKRGKGSGSRKKKKQKMLTWIHTKSGQCFEIIKVNKVVNVWEVINWTLHHKGPREDAHAPLGDNFQFRTMGGSMDINVLCLEITRIHDGYLKMFFQETKKTQRCTPRRPGAPAAAPSAREDWREVRNYCV